MWPKVLHPEQHITPTATKDRCDMTTKPNPETPGRVRLPDPPRRNIDEVTAYDHLHKLGTSHHLIMHFGKPETTLVETDRWLVARAGDNKAQGRVPDLLIAFDVRPEIYRGNNGYIVSEQGKPPDFVLEVASESTGQIDAGVKRRDYAALGIPEYWRFDHTGGDFHGAALAGDRLAADGYAPIQIDTLADGVLQGYSRALNLFLRWDHGELAFIDPATETSILTYDDQQRRADDQQRRADDQQRRADNEAALRRQAEERVRELEEENRRLRGQ